MNRKGIVAHSLIVVVVLLSLVTSMAQAAPPEAPPNVIAIAGSPLRIEVASNMSIQVYHQNYEHGATYGDADSGPFWYIDGQTYGPNMPGYGESASFSSSELTWIDHQGPSGSGTQADPWRVQTRGQLGAGTAGTVPTPGEAAVGQVGQVQPGEVTSTGTSALEVTQLVSYVNGRNYFQLDWTMTNRGGAQSCFKFYHAADIYFANSDYGYGYYDTGSGSVGGYDEGRTWFMVFAPITRPDRYREAYYGSVWEDVQAGRDLDNTINSEYLDNGIGLQWNICLAPGESKTVSDVWSFGQSEAEVIPTELARATPQGPAAVDVMVRDHVNDDGSIPSNPNGEPFWMSPDIIVRHQADGQAGETDFQNPVFGQTNYVYVTVRNIGTQDATDVAVNVYWADPALLLVWPDSWSLIGSTTVDVPAGGQTVTPEIAWSNLPSAGHRCLLVRLVTDQDPIRNEGNVPMDNNIAQRNLHILDMGRSTDPTSTTGSEDVEAIVVGPPNAESSQVDVVVQYPDMPEGAQLVVSMDGNLFDRWMQATNGDVSNGTVQNNQIVTTGQDETIIHNLPLTSGEQAPLKIHVEAPTADPFSFQVTERVNGVDAGGNVYWYTALLPEATPAAGEAELPGVKLPSELTCSIPCTGAILLTVLVLWLIRR